MGTGRVGKGLETVPAGIVSYASAFVIAPRSRNRCRANADRVARPQADVYAPFPSIAVSWCWSGLTPRRCPLLDDRLLAPPNLFLRRHRAVGRGSTFFLAKGGYRYQSHAAREDRQESCPMRQPSWSRR